MNRAFIFPGQGSQKVGMADEIAQSTLAKTYFKIAEEKLNFDLFALCQNGPQEELTKTKNAQPAILTVSLIYFELFKEKNNLTPLCLAGHSLGEYSALVAAGAMQFSDAVYAVHKRGEFMQKAVPEGIGSMAAILGMDDDDVALLCQKHNKPNSIVAPANYNTPGQVVIAGHKSAVENVLSEAKGKLLDVSAPFHTELMQPVADQLKQVLESIPINDPSYPVIANCDNQSLTNKDDIIANLIKQVVSPVQWSSGVQKMITLGAEQFIEFGAGKILTGMLKRIDRSVQAVNINSLESIDQF